MHKNCWNLPNFQFDNDRNAFTSEFLDLFLVLFCLSISVSSCPLNVMFHPVFFLISRSCNSLNFFRFMLSEQLRKKCYRAMSGLIFSVEFSSNFRYNYASFWNVAVSLECRKKVVILMLCTICWNNFRRCILFFFIYLLRFHEICSSLISFIKCLISCSSNVNNQSWIPDLPTFFSKKKFYIFSKDCKLFLVLM